MMENNETNGPNDKEQNEIDAAFDEVMDAENSQETEMREQGEELHSEQQKKISDPKKRKRIEWAMKLVLIAFVLTGAVYFTVMSMNGNQNNSNVNPTAPDYTAVEEYATANGLDIALIENVVFDSTNPTESAVAGSAIRYWVNLIGLDGNGNLTVIKVENVSVSEVGAQGDFSLLRQNVIGLYDKDQDGQSIAVQVTFCGLSADYNYQLIQQEISSDNLALLVNTRTGLSSDYGPAGMYYGMEAQAGHALVELLNGASAAGYDLWIASDYRSYSQQLALYNSAVASLGADQQDTAKPGYSEHQTGWAVDLTWSSAGGGLSTSMKNTAEYQWLMENSYLYGFVLRYPEGLTDVTGYYYEPWHFRYVGVELATEYHESGVETLDEFLSIPR